MSSDQIGGLVRTLLAVIGGVFIGKGWITAAGWEWIAGGTATAVPAVWSWFSNRPSSIAAAAQNIQGVNVQVTGSAPAGVATAVAIAKGV